MSNDCGCVIRSVEAGEVVEQFCDDHRISKDPFGPIPRVSEPNDGPGPDGHHLVTGECFACLVGVATGPESHGDHCPAAAPETEFVNGRWQVTEDEQGVQARRTKGGGPAPRREGRPA